MYIVVCACVFCLSMCPRCGVYTWSSGLISQWVDHMTCVVSWAYKHLPQRLSPRKDLTIAASQATEPPTFESQLRESQLKAAIVALTEGSSAATVATTEDDEDGNEDGTKGLDKRFADNFNDIDWSRLPLYCKPVATQKQRKSWVYRYGYRVALIKDPDRLFFVCRYCH